MERRAGLPAGVRATMMGLNLAKPLKFTSWLLTLSTTTTTTTPEKRPCIATTSPPSTTSHEPSQIGFCEHLNTCLYSNGAMDPFHNMFDQSLLDFEKAEPETKGTTNSPEPLQIACPSDRVTFRFEGCDLKSTMTTSDQAGCGFEDVRQNMGNLAFPAHEQGESISIFPLLASGNDHMVSFRSSFPNHLLSDKVDDIPSTHHNTASSLEAHPLYHPITLSLGGDSMVPFHAMLGGIFGTTAADLSPLNVDTASKGSDGRASPQLSTTTGESCSSLSYSPTSSRRSSWATSISTHIGEDDIEQSIIEHEKPTAEHSPSMDEIELIHEYQHYCQLIELGDPQNRRDRDFTTQTTVEQGPNQMGALDRVTQDAGSLAVEASGDTAHDDPDSPFNKAGSEAREEQMKSEGIKHDTHPTLGDEGNSTPPSTPAEAAAWAHSYCDADPESAKLKLLTDDRGREFVLYHDCFHCVPIELAPEFMDMIDEEEEDDDGYGSATETGEAARDGVKLDMIPEEEDEG